ncbi:MAG: phosphoglycolate phosphatase [Xanthomonadales bacterium]|nr:phosphoglycolate phosphatase [Xanthomonadales bacterium]
MSQPEYCPTSVYPAAIVWDLDGTLVESAPDLATALNTLLNEQGQHGHTVANVRVMIGAGVAKLIERGFRASGTPLELAEIEALVPRFMEIYSACATDSTDLVPHAREVLDHFYHAGVRQGLCTNKPISVTRLILDALDIKGYFGSVVGGDSTSMKKPHPLPLLTCLEELKTRPEDAIMIGDSGADVGAARAANVPVILVPDGYTGVPAVSLGADYVVGRLADIPSSIPPYPPLRHSA